MRAFSFTSFLWFPHTKSPCAIARARKTRPILRVRDRKKAPCPWREVRVEELAISASRTSDISAGKACHDFAKNCNVIFWLRRPHTFDAEMLEFLAKPCERAAAQRAGEIVGRIWQQQPPREESRMAWSGKIILDIGAIAFANEGSRL